MKGLSNLNETQRTKLIYSEVMEYVVDYLEEEIEFNELVEAFDELHEILFIEHNGIYNDNYTEAEQLTLDEIGALLTRRLISIEETHMDYDLYISEEELNAQLTLIVNQNIRKELK